MCVFETEGIKWGCGHYQVTNKTAKIDCYNRYCSHSRSHPPDCTGSRCACDKFYGPDAKEVVIAKNPDYCSSCHYWFRGKGAMTSR
ncbi:hypothetical protein PUNSTDRAFT_131973 [Punctularia strigosozonata HHB-11173 SS5]|uniref:uncharacterized protein n=1 Tax=Punctularia strigosozonata (strain HHB-11173) TaxID=741275 RepID=UPI000441685F|nr:uncharacterized protein PUNSTDRAFT_131973 [Punctularia strigosozonata HHB-11173 SS5]EIN11819.1 hypothetical protein PUNSTDRAFT_131973 [Punctularia strigosozonata HHB-11173 SS5]